MKGKGKGTREFNPGPPSNPRRLNFYGAFSRGKAAKRHRLNLLHGQARHENALRSAKENAQ